MAHDQGMRLGAFGSFLYIYFVTGISADAYTRGLR